MGEFPLILFTVLSQLAAGAAITLTLLDYFTDGLDQSAGKKSTLAVLIVTAGSLMISLLHVGHPFNVYRAITNLGSSWLSREALLFGVLAALLIVYYLQWKEDNTLRKKVGLVITVVSVLAVISSGMIYKLPAIPAWNNLTPVIFFLLTSAVLGPLFILVITKSAQGSASSLVQLTGIILVASLACFVVYLTTLLAGSGAAASTGANMITNSVFWPRILANWVLPLGILAWLTIKKNSLDLKVAYSLFALVLVGELLGRYLFYYSAVILKIAGM